MASPQSIVNRNKQKTSQKVNLQFPADLGDYQMILTFKKYDYSTAQGNAGATTEDSFALPLPSNLVDSSRIEVGGKQIGTMGALAADAMAGLQDIGGAVDKLRNATTQALKSISGGVEDASKLTQGNVDLNAISQGISNLGTVGTYALRGLAGKISPQIEQGVGSVLGNAMNPHATLVFEGVDLKIHSFEWVFAPRNDAEADALNKIIKRIQYHIHPEYKSVLENDTGILSIDRGLLSYPSLLQVDLAGINQDFIIKFNKMLMVNQFNVDYTPQGLSLNRGGKPAIVRCSMNVTESTIRTRADYESDSSRTGTDNLSNGANRDSTSATTSGTGNTLGSGNPQSWDARQFLIT